LSTCFVVENRIFASTSQFGQKSLDRDRLATTEEQEREKRAMLRSAKRDLAVLVCDLEAAQERKEHPVASRALPDMLSLPRAGEVVHRAF
jgi:hypothetical protein